MTIPSLNLEGHVLATDADLQNAIADIALKAAATDLQDAIAETALKAPTLMPAEATTVALLRFDGADLIDTPSSGTAETFTTTGTVNRRASHVSGAWASDHLSNGYFLGGGVGTQHVLTGDMTFEAVVKHLAVTNNAYIAWCGGDPVSSTEANNALYSLRTTASTLAYVSEHGAGTGSTITAVANVDVHEWNHVAFTRSGTTVKIFVNGLEAVSGAITAPTNTGTPLLRVGGANGTDTYNYDGLIRDVRISNTVKTPAQILAASIAALGQ